MKWVRKTVTVLWKCWFIILTTLFVLTIGVFWTFPFSMSQITFPIAYKGIRLWAVLIFYGCGFRLEVKAEKKLNPNQQYIFIANHASIIDIMVMAILHKHHPVVFVGKEELAKFPIFGTIYRRICIVVNRADTQSRIRVFKATKEKLSAGNSIVLFPEGGIPHEESLVLQHFKDGAFSISIFSKIPVVVYAIKGTKEHFPWAWAKGSPGKIKVKLIDIIPTENLSLADKDDLNENCYHLIYNELINNNF